MNDTSGTQAKANLNSLNINDWSIKIWDSYGQRTVSQCKDELAARKLSTEGKKFDLVFRLFIDDLIKHLQIQPEDIIYGFLIGSQLYGCGSSTSDFDLLIITKPSVLESLTTKLKSHPVAMLFDMCWIAETKDAKNDFNNGSFLFSESKDADVTILSKDTFDLMVKHCSPIALECLSAAETDPALVFHGGIVGNESVSATLPAYSKSQIYRSFGTLAKNSWDRYSHNVARLHCDPFPKKPTVQLHNKLQKRGFHAVKTLLHGCQVAQYGMIRNFAESNELRKEFIDHVTTGNVKQGDVQSLLIRLHKGYPILMEQLDRLKKLCQDPNSSDKLDSIVIHPPKEIKTTEPAMIIAPALVPPSLESFRNIQSEDIVRKILLHLDDTRDVYSCSLVSKQWFHIVHNASFAKELCIRLYGTEMCEQYETTEMKPNWITAFKSRVWERQFEPLAWQCPSCTHEPVFLTFSNNSKGSITTLQQAYRASKDHIVAEFRRKIFFLACVYEGYDGYCSWHERHIWGQVHLSQIDKALKFLDKAERKSKKRKKGKPNTCWVCSGETRVALPLLVNITPDKNEMFVMCVHGHITGRIRCFQDE